MRVTWPILRGCRGRSVVAGSLTVRPPQRHRAGSPDPVPGPYLRHWGLGHRPRSRAQARWRRSPGGFINRSPGCRQGTILAPVAAWLRLPGSCGLCSWPLNISDRSATKGRRGHGREFICTDGRWSERHSVTAVMSNHSRLFRRFHLFQAAETQLS